MEYRPLIQIYLLFLSDYLQPASAVTHSLQYFYTGITPGINFPQFTAVGLLDGEQFVYYDSNIRKMIPKTEWMKKIEVEDYWDTETQVQQNTEEVFKTDVEILMQRFNNTQGVHTLQVMYGCELHDDGTKIGYRQDGYDGEDFISLDLDTETWTTPKPQAVPTKLKWEKAKVAKVNKAYMENECAVWLQKYVEHSRDTLERKVPPEVSLFQKDSSSPVVCHATGFFPREVTISWMKNGEDLHEDVELRETLPNQDGTFQKISVLRVSPEALEKNEFTCGIQHSSLEENMVLQVSGCRVLSGGGYAGFIVGAVVTVLLLVLIGYTGVYIWRKKQ